MIDEIILFVFRMLFWISLYLQIDRGFQDAKQHCSNKHDFRKGDKAMFDKKLMKKIKMNKVGEYLMMGEPVFMVMMDGSLVEIEGASDMGSIFFHNLTGGAFAVYRSRSEGFAKSIKLGGWTFSVNYEKEGGEEEDVLNAG